MAEVAFGSLLWQRAASNSPDFVAPYLCDFVAASSYRFTPRGTLQATPSTVTGAEAVVVDNMLNGVAVMVTIGPIIEVCPAYQKTNITIDPLASPDVIVAASSGNCRVYFYTGAFHGNTNNINTYAAYKAGVVSTNTDGTQNVYFNTVKWKSNSNLANGFNLDNLTDSGFFDVLNPTSPASGNLAAGTYLIEAFTYSGSNLYLYQKARNILSPDTQVWERRCLGGSGWTAWRNIGLSATGGCLFTYQSTTQCIAKPVNGGLININGNIEQIPGAGVAFPNTIGANPLSASTVYYAYLYMTGQAMNGEWSTTGYVLDANGNPVKSGDATRTCVGLTFTDAAGKFTYTAAFKGVLSYFNRQNLFSYNTYNQSTASTSFAVLFNALVLKWGTEPVIARALLCMTAANICTPMIVVRYNGVDATPGIQGTIANPNYYTPIAAEGVSDAGALSDGVYNVALNGKTNNTVAPTFAGEFVTLTRG